MKKKNTLILISTLLCTLFFAACGLAGCDKREELSKPSNLEVSGTNFTWDAVANADTYTVQINNAEARNVGNATSYSIANYLAGTYTLKVKASGDDSVYKDSPWASINYTVASYDITYVLNGGINHPDNPASYTSLSPLITLKNPTQQGYLFSGWEEEGTIPAGSTGNKTFTAVWSEIYSITYVLSGGTNHRDNPDKYSSLSPLITLKDPTKKGYLFAGWEEGSTITAGSTGNKTFTAVWSEIYTITYNLGGGTNHRDNPAEYTAQSPLITLKNPTRNGYYFVCWTEGSTILAGSTGKKTFTAEWVLTTPSAGLFFTPVNGGYSVSRGNAKTSGVLVLPDQYNDLPVVEIAANGFANLPNISGIIIPNSVITIASQAFSNCTGIKNITLPDSVTNISSAFSGCTGLTSITIGSNVTNFSSAFSGCYNLTSITISDGVTTIGSSAFSGCSGLKSIIIPDSVTTIGSYAFSDCSGLTSVTIGDSVTSIGSYAFSGCTGLTSVNIGNSVTHISDYAFRNCTKLTSITIPDSVTTIGSSAFFGCSLNNMIVSTGNTVLKSDGNCLIRIADNVLIIGCKTSVIPDYVANIGDFAFSGCTGLISITIPDGVTTIGNSAFSGCPLTSITIPDSVTTIGNNAFSGCRSLISITIPDSVTTIGSSAFYGCIGITSIAIPVSVTTIGSSAFSGCSLNNIIVSTGNTVFKSDANCLIRIADNVLIAGCRTSVIPDYVTGIGDYAFYRCTGLTSITIPDGVTSIGDYAFYDCSDLISITIPDGVITIGSSAFYDCIKLTSITIPDSVTTIGNNAFCGCDKLTSITIGDSVTTIGSSAFSYCDKLTSITIPDSVTTIGSLAFTYSNSLTIYTEATSKPDKWDSYWNYSDRPVVWGCILSGDKAYVESFTKISTSVSNPSATNGIKAPYRKGYTFKEWNTNQDGTGTIYNAANINTIPNDTTVYAIWTKD